jgi:hypothetical protein
MAIKELGPKNWFEKMCRPEKMNNTNTNINIHKNINNDIYKIFIKVFNKYKTIFSNIK